ncbi:Phosphomethylpyrimidine synthase [Anaerococcus prevotii]|uniref:Phosphomethylpyrimidine synthase n=1 Tax=Anaerococcus prevotii (strain ATCC 9321 / DSM 20548 / JCM 6508 / NCTC 11806 / PC1) TaxID=525919 RepID=C7RD78_ANAPD|nr:phosphomethylpyrimidine synthase ThiC [Anaerococcus prevotii]ACV29141.1 thiamine biosynthesis protein ThiC [Anaerococcus prevotii DSM 20548]SUU94815.1 Phosphomethylpyrimidine synthase [Anaerococcus prevotii]
MKYKTQMEAAKNGFVTEEMKIVAKKENVSEEFLLEKIAKGEIVIPRNKNHNSISPEGIGTGLRTKINVNLGISKDINDLDLEMQKVDMALDMGAESIMDLSNYGKTQEFRKRLIEKSTAMIGTVPMYDAVGFLDKGLSFIKAQEFLDVVRNHAENGVDFVTIHCGINRANAEIFMRNRRVNEIVSRGGSLLFGWMMMNDAENPFYEYYDELLDILREYDVTLSLGDSLRPGGIHDATDPAQIAELITLGELTKRAWEKDVQVIIEGPGHVPINDIEMNMKLEKKLCHNAPFYVLGPLVCDVAPGYDHITSAIGGAIAASHGADFLCYVTPAEHLRLPDVEDVREGIVAAKIAAHAGDIAKLKDARKWDLEMSKRRQKLDWEGMFELAIDPEKCRAYRAASAPEEEDTCTMCGAMCSARNMNLILEGKDIVL